MNDKTARHVPGSRNRRHHYASQRNQSVSENDEAGINDTAPLPTRVAKLPRLDSDTTSPVRNPHRRSFSAFSSTAVPHRLSGHSSRLSISNHPQQRHQPNPQSPTIVERAISQVQRYMDSRLDDMKEQLRIWETNDFVNPGCVLPPIADPELYFIFDKVRLRSQKADVRQSGSFIGDRIYSECLLNVLDQWRLPRRCISILFNTFISKKYQDRLFHKWNALNFLVERKDLVKTSRAEMIELYCCLGSRDPLYEFSHASFEKQFAGTLQHALLPMLEYVAELYDFPSDIYNFKSSTDAGYKHIVVKTSKYHFTSEPILKAILHANQDNIDKSEFTSADQLWKAVISFSVPKEENHEFWQRSGLDRMDGNFRNSIVIKTFAFGTSQQEVKSFAMIKLINLIELIRMVLRNKEMDMKSLISKSVKKTARPIFPDMNCMALKMGLQLFAFYQDPDNKTVKFWHSLMILIKELLRKYAIHLKPLLEFYLIYTSIRQKQFTEAFQSLVSLRTSKKFMLSNRVSRRLDELQQLLCLNNETLLESLTMRKFMSRNRLGIS